jgi:hypothetical protein
VVRAPAQKVRVVDPVPIQRSASTRPMKTYWKRDEAGGIQKRRSRARNKVWASFAISM